MKTKIRSFSAVFVLAMLSICIAQAGTAKLPEIATPKLSAVEAVAIAERHLSQNGEKKDSEWMLVAVEWSRSDQHGQFRPRFSDGTQFHVTEAKNDWSWFLTYVNQDERDDGISRVRVLRVRDNGEVRSLIGTRT